ncbi:TRAP transporter permease [Halomarina ordinaria]|uniref:TRAP transporter permease n=1 Tax=Halomarina ordinaria TaxID=3033939 RepID=A0ABD5U6F3_9EURY|nr:TRAP transporter fused permease subunit [Halomarina sp. PSRA2]
MSETAHAGGMARVRATFRGVVEGRSAGELALWLLIGLLGVGLTVYTLYHARFQTLVRTRHSNVFLGVGLALFYLYETQKHLYGTEDVTAYRERDPTPEGSALSGLRSVGRFDWLLTLVSAVVTLLAAAYVETNFDRLLEDAVVVGYTQMDHLVGLVIVALVVDATRRAYGWAITSVVLAAIAYALVGPWLPGFLGHTGMDLTDVARYGAIGLSGTYGFILGVGTTWVAVFIMFAGLAQAYGALDYVLDVGEEAGSRLKTGVVQMAVVSSMAMGSITGSAAANTATTGSFTIPMMQRQGVRDDFAAAIESVASSGGQMMPPVMGVAAFLMADLLGISYVDVLQAALIPAILFYFSVGVAVQFAVLRYGWTTERTGSFDPRVLLKGVHFAVPLAVLVVTLVYYRLTPLSAGLYTTLVMVPTVFVRDLAVEGASLGTLWGTLVDTVAGLRDGALDMAPLVGVLAAMGIIIEMLTQTGLANKVSFRMVGLAGGVFVAVLLMAMVLSIVFGLGMPTPAAYILVVILVAPGIIEVGVPELVAHLFVFYFAMLSAITPPVAVAVAVGARIADADFLRTGKQAMRLGAAGFFIPFAFVTNESLIIWSFPATPIHAAVVAIGVVALVAATIGYDGANTLGGAPRLAYLALAVGALYAPMLMVQAGCALLVVLALGLAQQGRLPAVATSTRER